MTDAAPGTSSTPTPPASADGGAAPVTPPTTPPATPAAKPADANPADAKPADAKPADAKPSTPDKPASDAPLFTFPENAKLNSEATALLESFVRGKVADGKLTLTPQEVADAWYAQATAAQTRWEKHLQDQNNAWEAQSKQRFTPAQRAVAEAGVAFITSRQLAAAQASGVKDAVAFRDIAAQFMNHPEFVEAMRIVGDSLKEDTFEQAGNPPPKAKSLADRMYPKTQ